MGRERSQNLAVRPDPNARASPGSPCVFVVL